MRRVFDSLGLYGLAPLFVAIAAGYMLLGNAAAGIGCLVLTKLVANDVETRRYRRATARALRVLVEDAARRRL